MKRGKLLFVAGLAGLASLSSAAAQPTAGDPGTVAARYAACLVAERPGVADIYLASEPGSPEQAYAFNALVPAEDAVCASYATAPDGQRLEIPETILAGHIAEARYIVRFPSGPPPLIAESAPVATTDQEIAERLAEADNPALEFPRIFGDCVVRISAPDVDRLVRTLPGSPEAATIMSGLQPALGQCLWSGQTLEFSRETLRASLASALYRRGLTAVVPGGDEDAEAGR